MSRSKRVWSSILATWMLVGLILSACAAPTPDVVEVEKVVTKEVEKVVTKIVEEKVVEEVTKIVEVQVPVDAERWTGPGFGGIIRFVMGGAITSADTIGATAASTQVLAIHINESLVALSENYQIIPMLAESWDISEDGKTYTFYLRQGIKFHNGEEMTAADVMASFERFRQVSPRRSDFDVVESCTAADDYTVVFELANPNRAFLSSMAAVYADMAVQPKSVIEGKGAEQLKVPEEIIGTGPYYLAEFDPDIKVVLKRFEDYQPLPGPRDGVGGGKIPYADEIHILTVPETASQLAGLEAGSFDSKWNFSAADYVAFKGHPEIVSETFFPGERILMSFNFRATPTDNVTFRHAVNAALDMEELALFYTGGDRTQFRLNPYIWPLEGAMYLPDDPVAEATYNQNDVERARELLAETGYAGEELVWISTRDYETIYMVTENLVNQLRRKLDLNIKIEVHDWPSFMAKMEEPDTWHFVNTAYSSWLFMPYVLKGIWTCEGGSVLRAGYCNPEMDAAFEAAERSRNRSEEEAAWRDVQRIFWEDLVHVLLFDGPAYVMHREEVKGFEGWYRPRFFGVWKE